LRFGTEDFPPYAFPPGYLKIQNALSLQYIRAKAKERKLETDFEVPTFKVLPVPVTQDVGSKSAVAFMLVMLSLVFLTARLVEVIIEEKVVQLKETLRMLSVNIYVQWITWYIFSMTVFVAVAVVNTICSVVVLGNMKHPVVPFCHWSIMLVMLIIFGHAAVCLGFLISSIFNSRSRIYLWAVLCIFLTDLPTVFINHDSGPVLVFICSMFLLTGIDFSYHDVMVWGYFNQPLAWRHFFDAYWAGSSLGFGWKLVAMLLGSVVCLFLSLYIDHVRPGPFGVPKPWHFPCTRCWKKHGLLESIYGPYIHCFSNLRRNTDVERPDSGDNVNLLAEPLPEGKKVGIEIKNLCRSFGNKKAVQNLNLSILKDEVTILMGHNGAGKTTLISMLACFIPPTSGTALVNGYDITTQRAQARRYMGLCPQNNVLFAELSVARHIWLFARLRGMKGPAVKEEVNKYLEKLNLEKKRNKAAKKLSGGSQRRLNVACALCGGVKILLCDEPSSGLDPASRRDLWKLILEAKKGCTILLSTHHLDDGEALGDRIAIVSDGQLRCHGTLPFLKRQVDASSLLTCEMKKRCDVEQLTSLIYSHVGPIQPFSFLGRDVCYKLPLRVSSTFPSLFRDLEEQKNDLGIRGFGMSSMSLEEIFMTYGAEKPTTRSQIVLESGGGEEIVIAEEDETERNCADHWRAMMFKKMLYLWHDKIIFIVILLIPIIVVFWKLIDNKEHRHSMEISHYGDASLKILVQEPKPNEDGARQLAIFKDYVGSYCEVQTISQSPKDYIEDKIRDDQGRREMRFVLMAVDFENGITGWTGPKEILHAVPLTINVIYNVLAKDILGSDASIEAINAPHQNFVKEEMKKLLEMTMPLIYIILVLWMLSLFIVHERQSHMKQQQAVSGVSMVTYWMSHFVVDLLIFMIYMLALIPSAFSAIEWGRTLFVFFLIGAAALLFLYFWLCVASPLVSRILLSIGKDTLVIWNHFSEDSFIIACIGCYVVLLIGVFVTDYPFVIFLLYLHPLHCGYTALQKCAIMKRFCENKSYAGLHKHSLCVLPHISIYSHQCLCNDMLLAWFEEQYLLFLILLYFTLLMVVEYGPCLPCYALMDFFALNKKEEIEDPDTARKAKKIANYSESQLRSLALVVQGVSKKYCCNKVVNNISFAIKPPSCVGLLGPNGAGKTTTFKMIVGDTLMSRGDIFIKGYNVKTDRETATNQLGYCPQFDTFFEFFTGRQALHFFLQLRGTSRKNLKRCAEKLARDFGFYQHLDKKIKYYSGGAKRKINAAVASKGDILICMDEPSSGVDPASRRRIWNIYGTMVQQNKSVLLTSHNMDEINALCSKVIILVDGKVFAMGSNQNVKDKITQYVVLKMTVSAAEEDMDEILNKIEETLLVAYPGATLEEKYEFSGRLVFKIPNKDTKLSEIYGFLEKNRSSFNLADYSVSQPTLDNVFEEISAEKERKKKHKT
ncbi:hypothetical protein KR067_006501, partial [Drosophila pandora]